MAPEGALVGDLPTVRATLADVGAGLDLGASAASAKVYRNGVEVPDGVLVWVEGEEVVALEVMEAGPGVWTFQVTPVDAVGNVGDAVSARYTLDTGDPSVVITAPPAGAWVGGSLAAAAVASDVESAVERVHFEVSDALGATRVAELDAPPWEAALDLTGLAPGPLTLRASAWDAADNSAEATRAVRRDDLAPTVSVRAPSTAELVGPSATLTVAASDAESGLADVSVRVGDAQGELLTEGALTGAEGERTLALTRPLAHGAATLWVGARDAVGNVGGVVQVVSVDARAPTVSASPPAGTRLPGGATVTLTLRDGDDGFASGPDAAATAGTLVVRAGGLPTAHFTAAAEGDAISVTFNAALDGPVTVAVTPVDQLGNAGLPAIIDYVVDQRAPSATLTPSGVTATQITAITARFDEAVAEATVDLDDGLVATVDGERLAGSLTYASDARALTLRPDGLLPAGATVEVALAPGVADLLGNVATTTQRAAFTVGAPSFVDLVPWIDGLSLYRGETGERGEQHGPGGTFTDLDGDSYPDLALATGPGLPPELWLNVATPLGTGRTLSRVPLSDATLAGQAGIIAADYDNDGDQDLFVVCYRGENVLLRNDLVEVGVFGFTDVTEATRPVDAGPDQLGVKAGTELSTPLLLSMTAAWSDVNRDGLLDLYVGHHNGVYRAPDLGTRAGERDTLFLQQPDGTFVDVTMDAGVPGWQHQDGRYVTGAQRYSSTNGVVFADLNHDRWPDLIVTNKLRSADDRDMVYLNLGADASGEWLGFHPITYELPGNFGATNPLAMGIAPNDVDNDGDIDFYVTDWSPFGVVPGPNELWLNQFVETGHVGFLVDRSCCTGVYSWGAQLEDLDNDGLVDIHVATNVREMDIVYRQTSPGFFAVSGAAWGVNQVANSRGDLAADFNRDGWLDLFIVNDNEAPRLYLSQLERASSDRHWISIRLIGDPTLPGPYRSSRDAIGARVTITADIDGDGVDEHLTRMVFSGTGSGASTSSLEVEAGLGADAVVDVLIRWPSGRDTLLLDVAADQFLTVTEGP